MTGPMTLFALHVITTGLKCMEPFLITGVRSGLETGSTGKSGPFPAAINDAEPVDPRPTESDPPRGGPASIAAGTADVRAASAQGAVAADDEDGAAMGRDRCVNSSTEG